jgi:hypothetical protein
VDAMTRNRATVFYALAFLPVSAVAVALSGWVMNISNTQAPRAPAGLDGWVLNILPAFATGLLAYLALARFVDVARSGTPSFAGHAKRSAVLYLVAIGLGAVLLHDARSQDFWSFGQFVLWFWLVAIGGIAADALTVLRTKTA